MSQSQDSPLFCCHNCCHFDFLRCPIFSAISYSPAAFRCLCSEELVLSPLTRYSDGYKTGDNQSVVDTAINLQCGDRILLISDVSMRIEPYPQAFFATLACYIPPPCPTRSSDNLAHADSADVEAKALAAHMGTPVAPDQFPPTPEVVDVGEICAGDL